MSDMGRRGYDNCQAKFNIDMLHTYINDVKNKQEETNKEIRTNRKYDKAILAIGIVSFCINIFTHYYGG